jgi:hypothetical protein
VDVVTIQLAVRTIDDRLRHGSIDTIVCDETFFYPLRHPFDVLDPMLITSEGGSLRRAIDLYAKVANWQSHFSNVY